MYAVKLYLASIGLHNVVQASDSSLGPQFYYTYLIFFSSLQVNLRHIFISGYGLHGNKYKLSRFFGNIFSKKVSAKRQLNII